MAGTGVGCSADWVAVSFLGSDDELLIGVDEQPKRAVMKSVPIKNRVIFSIVRPEIDKRHRLPARPSSW